MALQSQAQSQASLPQATTQSVPSQEQTQLGILPGDCDGLAKNQLNGSYNRADSRMGANVPPPLMSQNIPMPRPGMNLNYISSQQQPQRMNYPNDNNFAVSIGAGRMYAIFGTEFSFGSPSQVSII